MPRFDIIYSDQPTSRALWSESVVVRDRTEAAGKAMKGLGSARLVYGAQCYRVVDGTGIVVTHGPNGVNLRSSD